MLGPVPNAFGTSAPPLPVETPYLDNGPWLVLRQWDLETLMNRVILCGRLTARPKSSQTPCGIQVAEFSLRVHREGRADVQPETAETDEIPCYAFRDVARLLTEWGERSLRVNLQGRLRSGPPPAAGRPLPILYLLVDRAYFVDPLMDPLLPAQEATDAEEPPTTSPTAPPLVVVRGDAARVLQ